MSEQHPKPKKTGRPTGKTFFPVLVKITAEQIAWLKAQPNQSATVRTLIEIEMEKSTSPPGS